MWKLCGVCLVENILFFKDRTSLTSAAGVTLIGQYKRTNINLTTEMGSDWLICHVLKTYLSPTIIIRPSYNNFGCDCGLRCVYKYMYSTSSTVEPLLYDHPQNHIGVVVKEGWSLVRDSYTNRNHCPSHEMWSYERDGRWWGWSFVRGSTVVGLACRCNYASYSPNNAHSSHWKLCLSQIDMEG